MQDNFYILWIGLAVVAIILFVSVIMMKHSLNEKQKFCNGTSIIEIGGCDHNGNCAVKLNTGEVAFSRYPLLGEPCK